MDVSVGRQNRYSPDGGVDGHSPGGATLFQREVLHPYGVAG